MRGRCVPWERIAMISQVPVLYKFLNESGNLTGNFIASKGFVEHPVTPSCPLATLMHDLRTKHRTTGSLPAIRGCDASIADATCSRQVQPRWSP